MLLDGFIVLEASCGVPNGLQPGCLLRIVFHVTENFDQVQHLSFGFAVDQKGA